MTNELTNYKEIISSCIEIVNSCVHNLTEKEILYIQHPLQMEKGGGKQ